MSEAIETRHVLKCTDEEERYLRQVPIGYKTAERTQERLYEIRTKIARMNRRRSVPPVT